MRAIGRYLLLAISLGFVAIGLVLAVHGVEGAWPAILFFGMCAAVFVGQIWPDILGGDARSPAELVAAFPEPVLLSIDRRRLALVTVGSAILGGVPVWQLSQGGHGGWVVWILWPCALLFCLATPVLAVLALVGGSLKLTPEGFAVRQAWRRSFTPWPVAGRFGTAAIPPSGKVLVVYDDSRASGGIAAANAALTGRNAALGDGYGHAPEDLAAILNGWRDRALAGTR